MPSSPAVMLSGVSSMIIAVPAADHQRVDKYPQSLEKPLLGRMAEYLPQRLHRVLNRKPGLIRKRALSSAPFMITVLRSLLAAACLRPKAPLQRSSGKH